MITPEPIVESQSQRPSLAELGCRFAWIEWKHCEMYISGLVKNPADGAARCMAQMIAAKPYNWWYMYVNSMCANPNPLMIALALQNPIVFSKYDLYELSANENDAAVDYLLAHPESINFRQFSKNSNDRAFRFLTETCPDKIVWIQFVTYNRHPELQAFCERWAAETDVAVTEEHYYKTVRYDPWHADFRIDDTFYENMTVRIRLMDFVTKGIRRRNACEHNDEDVGTSIARINEVHNETKDKLNVVCEANTMWTHFSSNPHDRAVNSLLKEGPECIVWDSFCANPNPIAVDFLKQSLHKVAPELRPRLFANRNPELLRCIMEDEHSDIATTSVLKECIPWYELLANPAIFLQ